MFMEKLAKKVINMAELEVLKGAYHVEKRKLDLQIIQRNNANESTQEMLSNIFKGSSL